jgi:hypothetical protein
VFIGRGGVRRTLQQDDEENEPDSPPIYDEQGYIRRRAYDQNDANVDEEEVDDEGLEDEEEDMEQGDYEEEDENNEVRTSSREITKITKSELPHVKLRTSSRKSPFEIEIMRNNPKNFNKQCSLLALD